MNGWRNSLNSMKLPNLVIWLKIYDFFFTSFKYCSKFYVWVLNYLSFLGKFFLTPYLSRSSVAYPQTSNLKKWSIETVERTWLESRCLLFTLAFYWPTDMLSTHSLNNLGHVNSPSWVSDSLKTGNNDDDLFWGGNS